MVFYSAIKVFSDLCSISFIKLLTAVCFFANEHGIYLLFQ